jgi:sec-independent protein translocase protein TatA
VFSQFGPLEIVLVIVVLLLIFGPKRLPSLGRQLGGGLREFKDSVTGDKKHQDDDEESRPALDQPPAQTPPDASADASEAQPVDVAPEQRG